MFVRAGNIAYSLIRGITCGYRFHNGDEEGRDGGKGGRSLFRVYLNSHVYAWIKFIICVARTVCNF